MREELEAQIQTQADFQPSRAVVLNPRTRKYHRDATESQYTTLIENTDAKKVAELFNACYEIVLLMLSQSVLFWRRISSGTRCPTPGVATVNDICITTNR